jgi:glucan endo-1,3-alpha-glucosidase
MAHVRDLTAVGFGGTKLTGTVSWDAWPKAGQSKMTTVEDLLYKDNLRGKKYMMGVSPWFYTGKYSAPSDGHCSGF